MLARTLLGAMVVLAIMVAGCCCPYVEEDPGPAGTLAAKTQQPAEAPE